MDKLRKWLIKAGFLGASGLALAGCATTSPSTATASLTACQGLTSAIEALTPLKPQMTPAEVKYATTAIKTAHTYCASSTPPANGQAVVSSILRSLQTLDIQLTTGTTRTAGAMPSAGAKS